MSAPLLVAQNLHKRYGDVVAVDGISLTLAPGEVLGLLGPNGAGKTTTIAMLSGLMTPDQGSVTLEGRPLTPQSRRLKARLGLVPQDLALYPDLTAKENLRFFGRIYGLRGHALEERLNAALAQVGLTPYADRLVKTYSGGMQRRLNFAVGLLHRPAVLFLDEPTVGVDPQSRNAIYELVTDLAAQGTAILYTTHYMEEAQRLCHRVAIMDAGRIIAADTPQALVQRLGGGLLRLGVPPSQTATLMRLAQQTPHVRGVRRQDGVVLVEAAHPEQTLLALLNAAQQEHLRLTHLEILEANLEAVFLALTGKRLRDA